MLRRRRRPRRTKCWRAGCWSPVSSSCSAPRRLPLLDSVARRICHWLPPAGCSACAVSSCSRTRSDGRRQRHSARSSRRPSGRRSSGALWRSAPPGERSCSCRARISVAPRWRPSRWRRWRRSRSTWRRDMRQPAADGCRACLRRRSSRNGRTSRRPGSGSADSVRCCSRSAARRRPRKQPRSGASRPSPPLASSSCWRPASRVRWARSRRFMSWR